MAIEAAILPPMRVGSQSNKASRGFTIVELLIVITIIALLAAITIVGYNGVQRRAQESRIKSSLNDLQKRVLLYQSENGSFPITTNNPKANWRAADVRTDANCSNGSSQTDWIPGIGITLPTSSPNATGVDGIKGCYIYVSNGTEYVISAWNMSNSPQTTSFYRRVGFRQFQSDSSTQFFTCNVANIGGVSGGVYSADEDYYKHSYTVSNISDCDETAP